MINLSKGELIGSALLILTGVCIGIFLSINLFAIDVDLLSVPYINKGVQITEDIEVSQNDLKIKIPKGAQLRLIRRLPSSNEYCILINSYWDDEKIIEFIENEPLYFELKKK